MTRITLIHGQAHQGSTYHISKQIIAKLSLADKEIDEYFMPKDGPPYCVGCYRCFNEGAQHCPHAEKTQAIVKSMAHSDIILIDSPTYCFTMTGQLKTLFDHFAYLWLSHRPNPTMFTKLGIVVSTTAGAGATKVTQILAEQMFWLGIPKVFRYSKKVNAASWETVPPKIKEAIAKDTDKLSKKIETQIGRVKPNLKLKFIFTMMRLNQKSNNWNLLDRNHWEENGWLTKNKPWKSFKV